MRVSISFMDAVFGTKKNLDLRYQNKDSKTGKVKIVDRQVTVDIPAGIDNGMNVRLAGQGAEGDPGARKGDLMVQVIVDDDDYFVREGVDIHTEVPISVTQAILGGHVDVKTLTGDVEMKIPKGTQPNAKLMMRGKGVPRLQRGGKGNHVVHLKIEIPNKISDRQEELLREFDEEGKTCGNGFSGKIAEKVGSALNSLFGGNDKDSTSKKNDDKDTKKKKEAQ
mmetsp:Transcript_5500/g.7980  ORF Transcript_5500/g.7980 Transcript_5500/m.7980 type:complete len:223 (-) Transcript_5500:117-785(-)